MEQLSRKMPEVPRADSKCSPMSEVHNERRKDRGDMAVQKDRAKAILWRGWAKKERKERGATTKNVCIVSCHTVSMVTSACTTFVPYSHPFDTDSQGATSHQCSPLQSRAQLLQTLVHLCMS